MLESAKFYRLQGLVMREISVIYGDIQLEIDKDFYKIPRYSSNPAYRMPFCHQSAFVKTALLKRYKFDTSFKICSDNDFFTKIYHLENARFFDSNEVVAIYDAGGISSIPSVEFFKEEMRIIAKYNKLYCLIFALKFINMRLKYLIKSILPQRIRIKIQLLINAKKQ